MYALTQLMPVSRFWAFRRRRAAFMSRSIPDLGGSPFAKLMVVTLAAMLSVRIRSMSSSDQRASSTPLLSPSATVMIVPRYLAAGCHHRRTSPPVLSVAGGGDVIVSAAAIAVCHSPAFMQVCAYHCQPKSLVFAACVLGLYQLHVRDVDRCMAMSLSTGIPRRRPQLMT